MLKPGLGTMGVMRRLAVLACRAEVRAGLTVLLLAFALWTTGAFEAREAPPFVHEEVRVRPLGERYMLAVSILRPRGDGPFGAVILNHGVAATAQARRAESPAFFMHTATAFAQRGYAVFLPLRRGFGATGGEFAEDTGPCDAPDFSRGGREAAADVLAAYDYALRQPYVDRSRMILAGQSAGGVASLHAAAQKPEGLVAVLAFAAGRGADPSQPGVPCAAEPLAAAFQELGNAVKAPVLLYYAENDRSFGPAASELWFRRFKAGGGRADYVLQAPFGADGHYLFSAEAGVRIWLPVVERFLERHGIPFDAPKQRA
jgi:dienelactone hydrolase